MIDIRELSRAYYKKIAKTLINEKQNTVPPAFAPDKFQKSVITSNDKFLRVVAPAGAGKTQTLTTKAMRILATDSKARVLCLTFTNAAANEFRERTARLTSSVDKRIRVSTVNAFGLRILNSLDKKLTTVKLGSPMIRFPFSIIKEQMLNSHLWNEKAKPKYYQSIYELIDLTKSLGFSDKSTLEEAECDFDVIQSLGMDRLLEDSIKSIGLKNDITSDFKNLFIYFWFPFWRMITKELWSKGILSFEDQKYWSLDQISSNKWALLHLKNLNLTHLFIDEFQDINVLDLHFIKLIVLSTGAKLVVVGDDDQCIYEWRGCTSEFIRTPNKMFGDILELQKESFVEIQLNNNYRCPQNIVFHSNKLISHNKNRINKTIIPKRNDQANIRVIPLPAAYLTMNVVDEFVGFLEKKHPQHTVAIVGRKKCQLIPTQILLTKRGTKFKVDADLNVFAGEAFKDFRKLLELPTVYTKLRSPFENITDLLALLNRANKYPINHKEYKTIQQWLDYREPKTLKEAVERFSNYSGELSRGYADPNKVSNKLKYFLKDESVVKCLHAAEIVFEGFQKDFVKSKEDIFYSEPPFSHLADLAVNYKDRFSDFLYDIDEAIERAESNDPRDARIELMTALRTKGREFDTVIVLDTNDGIFPNKKSIEEGRIEEERRLFYVTITRAKNNLLLFDSGRINGQRMTTSPFIKEMGLKHTDWLIDSELESISRKLLKELKI